MASAGTAAGMSRQAESECTELSFPRYRVEERSLDLATFIIGFADTLTQSERLVAVRVAYLLRARSTAERASID